MATKVSIEILACSLLLLSFSFVGARLFYFLIFCNGSIRYGSIIADTNVTLVLLRDVKGEIVFLVESLPVYG